MGTPGRFNCALLVESYLFSDARLTEGDPDYEPIRTLTEDPDSALRRINTNYCLDEPENISASVDAALFTEMRNELIDLRNTLN